MIKACFIEPMPCLSTDALPLAPNLQYELKLDGYRAIAFKTGGRLRLRSRNDKDFTARYPVIADVLHRIPDHTVIDGGIVAFDASRRPSFNTLQNYGSSHAPIYFYAFDLIVVAGRDLMSQPLEQRRKLLRTKCYQSSRTQSGIRRRSIRR